ncbi:GAPES1 domain-containing protein, partial [Escherichia coli]|uniref:GAPES1 domain-containing protein n=1 Tax=Escherichia coli TaxID=562 RepID=UPI003EE35301
MGNCSFLNSSKTHLKSANNTHGLNLTAHKYPGLRGTLQTASTDCDTIVEAAALLPAF